MTTPHPLKDSASRITSLFSEKEQREDRKRKGHEKQKCMRLNFFLLAAVFKEAKRIGNEKERRSFSFFPLFISSILDSKSPHFLEITKQAHSCCTKQDLHLFPFKQFFLRNEFTMKRVIEWRLSKYIKSKDQLRTFVEIMKETPPDTFRRYLVTSINQSEEQKSPSQEGTGKEVKAQEKKWDLWKHHADGDPFRVSRT